MTSRASNDHPITAIVGPDLEPSPDLEPLKTLISHLMSNEQRSQAISLFDKCKQTDLNTLVKKLKKLLKHSPDIDVRAIAAIMLGNIFKQYKSPQSRFKQTKSPQSGAKICILDVLLIQQNKPIIKILGHTISTLAPDGKVANNLLHHVASNDSSLQELALLIFPQLVEYVIASKVLYMERLRNVFMNCLGNVGSAEVRIAALIAATSFIQCLKSSSRFEDLLPGMITCLYEVFTTQVDEAMKQKALVLLIELAKKNPYFFTRHFAEVVWCMLAIANTESWTRHLVIDFLITLAEAKQQPPEMTRDMSQFIISRLFAFLKRMLLDIEDEAAWHSDEDEDAGPSSNYIAILKRMLLDNEDETARHSAENEDEDARRSSNYIFGKQCLHRLATAHPCVSLAAINALGQLSADLDPDLQVKYNSHVLPTLAKILAEAMCKGPPDQSVRLAAINVIVQLFAGLDPDLQFEYNSHVLPTLAEAMCKDPDFLVRLAAINVTVKLFADLDPDLPLTDDHHESVLYALHGAICEFKYLLVQDRAVNAMINISMNYPLVTPRYLRVTVGTLLERRREEDIASDQTSIRAIRNFLEAFEENLPRDTWTSTFNRLRPEQQAEFRSIREEMRVDFV